MADERILQMVVVEFYSLPNACKKGKCYYKQRGSYQCELVSNIKYLIISPLRFLSGIIYDTVWGRLCQTACGAAYINKVMSYECPVM